MSVCLFSKEWQTLKGEDCSLDGSLDWFLGYMGGVDVVCGTGACCGDEFDVSGKCCGYDIGETWDKMIVLFGWDVIAEVGKRSE